MGVRNGCRQKTPNLVSEMEGGFLFSGYPGPKGGGERQGLRLWVMGNGSWVIGHRLQLTGKVEKSRKWYLITGLYLAEGWVPKKV